MKSALSSFASALLNGPHDRWAGLGSREKNGLLLALAAVLGALLWFLLLAPAIATLRSADAQARTLDAQLGRMRSLQLEVSALQKQPVQKYDEALRALTSATNLVLGSSAKLSVLGDRANVTLQDSSADDLARWLSEARVNAQSVPIEVRLTRSPLAGAARWNGLVVMRLPSR